MKQGSSIGIALAFFLFPALLFASRQEAVEEALREWEPSVSTQGSGRASFGIDKFSSVTAEQAVSDLQKYWEPKVESGPKAPRRAAKPVKKWQLIPGINFPAGGSTDEETESIYPASNSLQDYYDCTLEKYENEDARYKEELEKSIPFKRKEGDRSQANKQATWAKLIPKRISRAFEHKAETPQTIQPESIDLQGYYARLSREYAAAEDKEKNELEQEMIFRGEKSSQAAPAEARGVRYVSAGFDFNHMHYKETRGGNTLDEDYGKLKGFYLGAGYKSNRYMPWIMGRPFIEAYYRRHSDLVTYDGASGLGPLSFEEKAEVHRFGVKAGARRDFFKKGEIYGYFDLGKRIWYRGENEVIQGVLTYAEKYWWVYYGLGVGLNYRIWPKFSCGVDFEAMLTHKSQRKMRADLYEGATFQLGGVYGIDLKLPLKYMFRENVSFDFTPYFTWWEIHESDTRMISGLPYVEPDSKTHIEGVLIGLSYLF